MQKYSYHIDQADYLLYLFYSTSKSKRVQKRRALNKLVLMMIYVLTGIMIFSRSGPIASAAFFLLCIPVYFLFNMMERKQYNKHFTRFINDHFKDRVGKPASIELQENAFRVLDEEDNTFPYEEIEYITETGEMIIVQLNNGVAILLPKARISEHADLITELKRISGLNSIPYNSELDWKWK